MTEIFGSTTRQKNQDTIFGKPTKAKQATIAESPFAILQCRIVNRQLKKTARPQIQNRTNQPKNFHFYTLNGRENNEQRPTFFCIIDTAEIFHVHENITIASAKKPPITNRHVA
jgi:hypothetical protein